MGAEGNRASLGPLVRACANFRTQGFPLLGKAHVTHEGVTEVLVCIGIFSPGNLSSPCGTLQRSVPACAEPHVQPIQRGLHAAFSAISGRSWPHAIFSVGFGS